MECDSVHSNIEIALKTHDVYNLGDYYRIVAMARQRSPYSLHKSGNEWRYCPMAKDKVDALP